MVKPVTFVRSALQTVGSTVISSALLAVLTLLLPKFISKENYGYFQLYLFYAVYLGYASFGIADGLFLRFAGKSLSEIPRHIVSAHLRFLFSITFILFTGAIFACYTKLSPNYAAVISLACTGTIFYLLRSLITFVYQAANIPKLFAQATVLERVTQVVLSLMVLGSGYRGFAWFLWADVLGRLVGLIYTGIQAKSFVVARPHNVTREAHELAATFRIGIFINLASISTVLVTAVGRFAAEKGFGIGVFAEASLAFALQNIVLTVVAPISLVMVPNLRKRSPSEYSALYRAFIERSAPFLVFTLLSYFPLLAFCLLWLPDYESLPTFVGVMTPIIFFDTRTRVFAIPFLQALRYERVLAAINVACLILAVVLALVSVNVLKSPYWLMVSLTATVATRSVALQAAAERVMKISRWHRTISEVFLMGLFIIAAANFENVYLWLLTGAVFSGYAVSQRGIIWGELGRLWRRFRHRNWAAR